MSRFGLRTRNGQVTDILTPEIPEWVRPSDWLSLPDVSPSEQKIVALHAIFDAPSQFATVRCTTSTGDYRVNWGDGTTTDYASNVVAEHTYDYSTYDTANRTLSERGYKQAIITITPVTGNLLTVNFQFRRTTTPAQTVLYSTGYLDMIISMPNADSGASILLGGTAVRHGFLERVQILNVGGMTNCSNMFRNCISLESVNLFDTSSVTNMSGMFRECLLIKKIPHYNTAIVSNMSLMFQFCSALPRVPLFDTSSVTNMSAMFNGCSSLQSIPIFNTSIVNNMSGGMFQQCLSLTELPALSTAAITTSAGSDFGNFALNCNNLKAIKVVFARAVNISNSQLSRDALVDIFNNLVDRSSTTAANINITGNWGAAAGGLSAADREIATDKNWTITG
jgi:surface protein